MNRDTNTNEAGESTPEPEETRAESKRSRQQRREDALQDLLRAYVRDLALEQFGDVTRHAGVPPEIELNLRAVFSPQHEWESQFKPSLSGQVVSQLDEVMARPDAYCLGKVYCYRCRSSHCGHGMPPDPLSVFRGYSSTGVPEWHPLLQALVDSADPRVDGLYARPPVVLATVQLGKELKLQQLAPFGRSSRTYSILGQVAAGFLCKPGPRQAIGPPDTRLAVTVQVVEIRDNYGGPRLKLNVIAGGMDPDEWNELLADKAQDGVARAIRTGEESVAALEKQMLGVRAMEGPAAAGKTLKRVPTILRRLARALEQGGRRRQRRTQHAEKRREEHRPVSKALDDTQTASDSAFFHDLKRDTWVVCGRQGRTHVFNQNGRHVTSFILKPGGADFRLRTQRWRRMEPAEIKALRDAVPRAITEQDAEDVRQKSHARGR